MARIKKVKVTHLALCKRGKNQFPVVYKSDDGSDQVSFEMLVKEGADFNERGEVLFVAFAPETPDKEGHVADAEVCRQMGHSFMQEGAKLNIRHGDTELKKEQAYVAESFTIQAGDPRFQGMKDYNGKPIDVTNGWGGVLKLEDPELRKLYKSEGWNGVSLQGPATLSIENSDDSLLQKFLTLLKSFTEPKETKEEEMTLTKEDLKLANEELVKNLAAALKPAPAKTETTTTVAKSDEPPEFKGDPTKAADVEAHAKTLEHFELRKSVDWKDPKSVRAYLEKMAPPKEDPADGEDGDGEDGDETDPKAKGKPYQAKKSDDQRSDQPTRTGKQGAGRRLPEALRDMNLSKEEVEGYDAGDRMAKAINDGVV